MYGPTYRVLTVLMLLGAAMPAQAARIFQFTLTGSTPAGAIQTATGSIALTDQAFDAGIDIAAGYRQPVPDWLGLGLISLSFTTNGQSFSLANLVQPPIPLNSPIWTLSLRSMAGETPTGSVSYNNSSWDVTYRLDGAASGGSFNTDGPGANGFCFRTGVCSFTGNFAAISLPEPSGALVLAGALTGLASARRRRPAARR